MFQPRTILKYAVQAWNNAVPLSDCNPLSFQIEKVLVMSKLSRYEYERRKHKQLNRLELEKELKNRGTDFDQLLYYHNLHKKFEHSVVETLEKAGIEVEVTNRFNYTEAKVNWADAVIPTGGDGTFLLAASRVRNNDKPVIGFNSDPNRSEGHLCLPKKYTCHVKEAISKLRRGAFTWLNRSRIRITLISPKGDIAPKYLHEIDVKSDLINPLSQATPAGQGRYLLPILALNEVFVGEALSARVSHLGMRLNGASLETNIKCSGVCVCTGTGSTSWNLSINRLPVQSVSKLLGLIREKLGSDHHEVAAEIANLYNKSLTFPSDTRQMAYTIRDLISSRVWPRPAGIQSRDFVDKLEIKSSCYDANLVVDGGVSFPFNDGTIALLEIKPEDALRTVVLDE